MAPDSKKSLGQIGYTEAQKEVISNDESHEGDETSGVSEVLEKELGSKIVSSIRKALYSDPGKNAAFREWLLNLRPGDQMPRGRYFAKRRKPDFLIIYDEPIEFRYYS